MNSILKHRYSEVSNLNLVVRSTRRKISTSLENEFGDSNSKSLSYLILSLSAKEYCHATSLEIDQFTSDEFETIARYYAQIVNQSLDRNLLLFSTVEIPEILESVGSCIRSTVCAEELFIPSN